MMTLRHLPALLLTCTACALSSIGRAELNLTPSPASSDDLAFSGAWTGVPTGEKRYVSRAALAALPGAKTLTDRTWPTTKPVEMTVVPLAEVIAAIGWTDQADGVVLRGEDRWESWMPAHFLQERDPYLLLYYKGKAPAEGGWPDFGGIEPMAPYYAFVSPTRFPDFKDQTPFGMISATQIAEIVAATEKDRYAPFYAGALAELEGDAAAGRTLFLARCNVCHQGPGETGGNVSQRPFMLLQVHATLNADYFKAMVRDPKKFYPGTIMPRHPDLTAANLNELIAFLAAAKAGGIN